MADLLTHVLVAFVLATVLSWWLGSISPAMVAAAMVGAVLPDLNRLELVLPATTVEALLGLPWTWTVLHRLGGTLAVIVLVGLAVHRDQRTMVVGMLVLGAASHYLLDALLWQADGVVAPLGWPLIDWQPAFEGWYRSMDRWPAVVATVLIVAVAVADGNIIGRPSPSD